MQSETPADATPKWMLITGWVLTVLSASVFIMSGVMKLIKPAEIVDGFKKMELNDSLALDLGVLEIACAAVYLFPRTSVIGAILLTGYLGGAILTHVRIAEQFVGPIIFGIMVWLGIYLRDARLRALIPWRS